MKVEVLKSIEYTGENLTHHIAQAGEVVDLPSRFVPAALQNREVKPFKEKLEVKNNNPAKRRTRKPSRSQGKPTDNLDS